MTDAFDFYSGKPIEAPEEPSQRFVRTNAGAGVPVFEVKKVSDEMRAFDHLPKRWQNFLDSGPKKYSAVQISELLEDNPDLEPEDGQPKPKRRHFGLW